MEKTRDISKVDYYSSLQREYITADFRRKIYYKPNDKSYWKKLSEFKKNKILSLSSELGLPSVFDNEEQKLRLISEFKNEGGRPVFFYKSDGSDKCLEKTDLLNYYRTDSDIKEISTGKIGKIISSTDNMILELGEVIIELNGEKPKISKLEEIVRII